MQKKVLIEKSFYCGKVKMPEGFEINPIEMASKIIETYITGQKLKFCKAADLMETYVREHLDAYQNLKIENLNSSGRICYANQTTRPELDFNSDFTLLYGVHVNDCTIHIIYEDNGKKLMWDISLTNNKFICFPSHFLFFITNKQENHHLNIIHKTTFLKK
jgi:hypothetical protein|tara:strand:+ start:539 stop:1021 length:483 start_codon:yes stop_codon:yes gene_type:complete